jgi:hypothetical protein
MRTVTRISAVTAMVAGLCAAAPQALAADGQGAAARSKPVVVVSGLNNPRQLVLVGNDELLIAEAGKGGSIKATGPDGETTFIGNSGSISVVYLPQFARHTKPNRIVRGLGSGAGEGGVFAVGSDGVAARSPHGPIYIQETFAPPGVLPKSLKAQNGRLLYARPYGAVHPFANITRFERLHDPDRHGFDSDPYAVIARRNDFLVADAAANDVLRVSNSGRISVFRVFPNVRTGSCAKQHDPGPRFPGCNFVPTSLATDAAGHVFVGGLSSERPRQGQVVELSADGKRVLRRWHGFTSVTGIAVNSRGTLYVSELERPESHPAGPHVTGVLTRISRKGVRSHRDVPFPAGVVVNSRGVVFVAAWSVASEAGMGGPNTSGQVWRLNW